MPSVVGAPIPTPSACPRRRRGSSPRPASLHDRARHREGQRTGRSAPHRVAQHRHRHRAEVCPSTKLSVPLVAVWSSPASAAIDRRAWLTEKASGAGRDRLTSKLACLTPESPSTTTGRGGEQRQRVATAIVVEDQPVARSVVASPASAAPPLALNTPAPPPRRALPRSRQ